MAEQISDFLINDLFGSFINALSWGLQSKENAMIFAIALSAILIIIAKITKSIKG